MVKPPGSDSVYRLCYPAGHNIASLKDLTEVLAGIERRHAT